MPAANDAAEVAAGDANPAAAGAHPCRNCGAPAPGHYCPNCGQETQIALPKFGAFMREAAGRYVALDGRLARTLFSLAARPGFLTLEYFNGRRRRYIRPARLFLVLYLALFAVIGLVQSPADLKDEVVFVNSSDGSAGADAGRADDDAAAAKRADRAPTSGAARVEGEAGAGADLPKGVFDDDGTLVSLDRDLNIMLRLNNAKLPIPDAVRKRYDQFKQLPREQMAEQLYAGALRFGPYAMVVLLPAFALLLKLVYLGRAGRYPGRPRRYAEHLVYSAHLHAFAALAIMAMLLLPPGLPRVLLACWIVYYVMRAWQAVYRGRWWGGLLRSLVIGLVYLVLISFAIVGLLAVAVMLR